MKFYECFIFILFIFLGISAVMDRKAERYERGEREREGGRHAGKPSQVGLEPWTFCVEE